MVQSKEYGLLGKQVKKKKEKKKTKLINIVIKEYTCKCVFFFNPHPLSSVGARSQELNISHSVNYMKFPLRK